MLDITIFIFSLLSLTFVTCPMAHNIYSHPDLSKTSKKFEAFTIDFRGIDTPPSTYWSLCNWDMDLSQLKEKYEEVTGGGAYGGLQETTQNEKKSILSFWEVSYKEDGEEKKLQASRIYPAGDESYFGGEGEGTHYINLYEWNANNWYRYVLHSWLDSNGETYVGQWIQDISTGEWTLFSYFNTHLPNSFITGALSQFQENFNEKNFGYERSFHIKNMYAYDKTYEKWISLNTSSLYYDPASWGFNTAGTHDIGYTTNYFYGSSGVPVDDQKLYDASNPERITGTIKQPENPEFEEPKFKSVDVDLKVNEITIKWSIDSTSTPCYNYRIDIGYKSAGEYKIMHNYVSYKPEETEYVYKSSNDLKGYFEIKITCDAISNKSITETIYEQINV